MEKTMDSIRPSDMRGEMSYMMARDPSILGFSQRPLPSEKRRLMSFFESEEFPDDDSTSSVMDPVNLQTVKVYLRLKPLPRKLKLTKEEAEAYKIVNDTTLMTKLPSLDHTSSLIQGSRMSDAVSRTFTFSHTFGPETTQVYLFEQVIQQRMMDFLAGQNATVMTYGTTNSGKSYTLQGTTTSPGIIPRGLEFVFSNINTRPTPSYKPSNNSDVVSLSPVDRAQELEAKNKLLTFASVDKHAHVNAYKQMQKLLQEESPIRPSQACDAQYSVWVSFAEIYNENIYDLLSNECQKRRPLLKLGTDNYGQAFIKGLKTVCVNSGSEAYQVLMAGQYNLKVAATALNARSSRSHCIFTIKLLKYYIENKPESVEVSTFAFCDLAGSERLKKTLNVGERLKEAQNINTSLLVLGRCLKSIYEGQSSKQRHEHVGPFRESKLTRLFQRALSGKEPIVLIVNVNPIPNLYVETQNVLNFSAIAKKIVVEPKKIKRKVSKSRFSQIVAQSKSNTDWNETELSEVVEHTEVTAEIEESVFVHQDEYDELLDENEGLKTEVGSLKKEIGTLKASMFNRDLQIRQELADMYTAMMKKLETDWKNRIKDVEEQQENYLEWSVNKLETFYKDKISELKSRKRRRSGDEDDEDDEDDDDGKDINELEMENERLASKVQSLKQKLKGLQADNAMANSEKNKFAFELGLTKDELKNVKTLLASAQEALYSDGDSIDYIEKLRAELEAKQERIKGLKEFLDEAKEEYIGITSYAEKMERRLKEADERLADRHERVSDLEELLEQVNACLAETTKEKETLEEHMNLQSHRLREADLKEQKLQDKLTESENTIKRLMAKILLMDPHTPSSMVTSKSDSTTSTESSVLPESRIKEEVFSESDGDASFETSKTSIPNDIIIKTDNDKTIGIPLTSYEDERVSEMFVELREIPSTVDNDVVEATESPSAELQAKLRDSEAEKSVLKTKLSQSSEEIQSLKESLELMKRQCNDITNKLMDLKAAQDIEAEKRTTESSIVTVTRDQASSPAKFQHHDAAVESTQSESPIPILLVNDEIVQTSFVDTSPDEKLKETIVVENRLQDSERQLEMLLVKYEKLEEEYKEKVSLMEKLEEELQTLRVANDSLRHKSVDDAATIETLIKKNTHVEVTFEKDLSKVESDKVAVEMQLHKTENLLKSLQSQIAECRDEHGVKISNLEKELAEMESVTKKQKDVISELKEAHEITVSQLESDFLRRAKELEAKIDEITKSADRCDVEKKDLEEKLKKNIAEIDALEKRLGQFDKRDQDKDIEIRQLQKALKTHLSGDIQDKQMEKELKAKLKELSETQESLRLTNDLYQRNKSISAKEIDDLKSEIIALSKKIQIYESNARHEKDEMERLQRENEELAISIGQKEREMESFMKNRDETNAKWEHLMQKKQEELDRSKIEIKRFQEHFHRIPTTPRDKNTKSEEETHKVPIPVVDLSASDTKRPIRRPAVPHPATCPSSEPKKSTRKKRLYLPVDELCIDVEPCDEIPPTPPANPLPASTRSLRNRRK